MSTEHYRYGQQVLQTCSTVFWGTRQLFKMLLQNHFGYSPPKSRYAVYHSLVYILTQEIKDNKGILLTLRQWQEYLFLCDNIPITCVLHLGFNAFTPN